MTASEDMPSLRWAADPVLFFDRLWGHKWQLYGKQKEVMWSVRDNDETYVPAGNALGKDFLAGATALWGVLTHREARIITTSVKDDHLRVLWGEIGRFIQSSRVPLVWGRGGPLVVNHRDIRKRRDDGTLDEISYLRGMVSEKGEGLAGHHAAWTLIIGDEASGIDDMVYTQSATWAKRMLWIGNTNNCQNFFRRNVTAGDLLATT